MLKEELEGEKEERGMLSFFFFYQSSHFHVLAYDKGSPEKPPFFFTTAFKVQQSLPCLPEEALQAMVWTSQGKSLVKERRNDLWKAQGHEEEDGDIQMS